MKIYVVYNKKTGNLCYPVKYFDSMKGVTEYLEECKKGVPPEIGINFEIKGIDKIANKDGYVYNITGFDKENQYVRLTLDGCYLINRNIEYCIGGSISL